MSISSLTNLAITQLGQVTILLVLAGLLHRLLAERSPRFMFGVWALVILKAVTPPVVASPFGLFSWLQAPALTTRPDGLVTGVDWMPTDGPIGWLARGFFVLWLFGAAATACVAVARSRLLRRLLDRDTLPAEDPLVQHTLSLARQYGLRRPHSVVASEDQLGPAVAGIFKPALILPASLIDDRDHTALRPVLLHELVHLQRHDAIYAMLNTAARVLWWFNPLVWWATRRAEMLIERNVDLAVTRELQTSVAEYGQGLVRVLELRALLQPQAELAGLRPCQITAERLEYLRVSPRLPVRNNGSAYLAPWVRWGGLSLIATAVLPALPVQAFAPGCEPAFTRETCPLAIAADAAREPQSQGSGGIKTPS